MEPSPPQEPPKPPARKPKAAGRIGALLATLAAFALKFKFVFFLVKIFASSWTLILTLWLYAFAFGWRFGAVLVLLILLHELGHYAAFRAYGLAVRLPVFVPFLGAFTAGAVPADPEHAAYIALAGPVAGLVPSALLYGLGLFTHDAFWLACACFGAGLNLFNMIPVLPFDGGRVVVSARAIRGSARITVFALYGAVAASLAFVVWQTYPGIAPVP